MRATIRKIGLAAMVGLTALVAPLYVRNAEAYWPLSYSWYCQASSNTQVQCDFGVTNPGPSGYRYQWLFGDGSDTGRLASTDATHYYAVSIGQEGRFDVALIGYTSATSSSPDNFIECPISFANDYGVGGAPPYSGSCQ
jgi:hypothetical protein